MWSRISFAHQTAGGGGGQRRSCARLFFLLGCNENRALVLPRPVPEFDGAREVYTTRGAR